MSILSKLLGAKSGLAGNVPIKFNIIATCRNADGSIAWRDEKKNLIATVGRAVIAQRLAQDDTYTLHITEGALGDDTTPPANGDVALGNETFRKAPASYSASSNKAYITFVYAVGEATGTHKEFGTFIDGTATVDSGQLFSHVAVDWEKTSVQSLVVDCVYTIS